MKRLLLSTLFLLFAVAAFAQKGAVSGTVLDADTGESVAGAVLEVAPVGTPDQKQYFTSGYKGAVAIPSLAYGEYSLSVAFLGYNNLDTTFRVSASKVSLGLLKLKPGVQIETVVKEAKALRTSQKGDTVSYNAVGERHRRKLLRYMGQARSGVVSGQLFLQQHRHEKPFDDRQMV